MKKRKENEFLTGVIIGLVIVIFAMLMNVTKTFACDLSENDRLMLTKLVQAEAGNQPLLGKQYVVDVVLNRVDSEGFPDSVDSVIKQENQFSVMSNGAYHRAVPTEEDILAVELECQRRTNNQVLYFTAGDYGKYGEPAFKVQDHYFCK